MLELKNLKTLHGQVEYILSNFPHTRNSDLSLQAELAYNFFPQLEQPIYNWRDIVIAMKNVPTLDHIARVRRKVIEANKYKKYLPTNPDVAKARGIAQDVWKEYSREKQPTGTGSAFNVPEGYKVLDERDEL